jgi:tripartite-type tricarboxylate transporter receptor subunit TctC
LRNARIDRRHTQREAKIENTKQGRKSVRRHWVLIAAGAATALCPQFTRAQSTPAYPAKPVRVIVPTASGAATDLQARMMAQKLSESLRRSFVVENHPGAGYTLGYGIVARAAPDGYTLMASSTALTFVPALRPDLPNDPLKDFAPIALVTKAPFLLLAHPALPVKSTRELIALAKSKPDAINMGIANGSTTHMVSAWFISMAHVKLTLVSYKGTGQVMVDTIAGQIHTLFGNVLATLPYVKSGRLRALALSTAERSAVLPDLPTIAESGVPGFDVSTWHGWLAPAGTPSAIVNKLSAELATAVKSPDVAKKLAEDGGVPLGGGPEQLHNLIAVEVPRWRKVVNDAGMRVE